MPILSMGMYVFVLALLGLSMSYGPLCSAGIGVALIVLLAVRESGLRPARHLLAGLNFLLGALWSTGICLFEVNDGRFWSSYLAVPLFSSLAIAVPLSLRFMGSFSKSLARRDESAALLSGCLLGCWIVSLIGSDNRASSQLWGLILLTFAVVVAASILLFDRSECEENKCDDDSEPLLEPFRSCAGLVVLEGYDLLTPRERAVIRLSLEGKDVRSIAAEIGVAPSTVSSYRTRCCKKLGVNTLQDVVQRVTSTLAPPAVTLPGGLKSHDWGVLAPIIAVLLLCLGSRAISIQAGKQLAGGIGFALVGWGAFYDVAIKGAWKSMDVSDWSPSSLFDGAAIGLLFTEITFCPVMYLAPYLIASLLLTAAVLHSETVGEVPANYGSLFCGAAVAALTLLSSEGVREQLGRTPLAAFLLALAIIFLATAARREERARVCAAVSDVVLLGQSRVLAYLQGRGLGELQAKVALLTALGLDLSHVADTLCVSKATVSAYRTKAYKALDVHDRAALTELLVNECGFQSLKDKREDLSR